MVFPLITVVFVGYILGSLPFGYLVARAKGVDIFKEGSKSSGATNVRRTVGTGAAVLVLLLDALKGAAAAAVALDFRPEPGIASNLPVASIPYLQAAGLISAILGHSYSCFTKFRGGKGVATGAGGFAVLFPVGVSIALAIFIVTVAATRFVSLGSIIAALSLPFVAYFRHALPAILWVCVAVAVLVVYRHRANLGRIVAGTEPRLGKGGKAKA